MNGHEHEHEMGHYDVAVIGGGIAGLVAGLSAVERGIRVVVVDAHGLGGRARTTEREGFHYNQGAHALYLAGHLHPFLQRRGLDPTGGTPATAGIGVLRDGAISQLRLSLTGIATTPLLRPASRVRTLALMAKLPRMRTERFAGTTWADFLGNEPDDLAGVLAMLVRTGSYANAPHLYDAGAALGQLRLAQLGVRYVHGGWQTIVDSLRGAFVAAGGTVVEHRTVRSVRADGRVTVSIDAGEITAGAAVIAGLAPDAVERLTGATINGRERVGGPVHAAALDLALRRVHDGVVFGIDQPLYLSAHAPLAALAPAGQGLVSLLRYVPDGEADRTAEADRTQLRDLATMAGIADTDVLHERYLHRLVVANGLPIAAGGGLTARPAPSCLGVDGVFVAGDWVGPSFQLADASSSSAEAAAALAVAHSSHRIATRA